MHLGHLTRLLLAPALATGLVAAGLVTTAQAAPDNAERRLPKRIALPNGFQPEGIAIGQEPRAYLGSLADGDIYQANLRTGKGHRIHQGDGTPAVGLKLDSKERLWVAGGADGDAKVVNTRTGRVMANYELSTISGTPSFVNDVVLRGGTAWFTDSQQPVLYKVRPVDGRPSQAKVSSIPLTGAWVQEPDAFNANGISTSPNKKFLLVVQSATGKLFRVNPRTGYATLVRLGGYRLTNGDGLLRLGRTLFVTQNRDNKVVAIRLAKNAERGRLVRTLKSGTFDVPTTIASRGNNLYLPNARFTTTATPTTKYWVTRVAR